MLFQMVVDETCQIAIAIFERFRAYQTILDQTSSMVETKSISESYHEFSRCLFEMFGIWVFSYLCSTISTKGVMDA